MDENAIVESNQKFVLENLDHATEVRRYEEMLAGILSGECTSDSEEVSIVFRMTAKPSHVRQFELIWGCILKEMSIRKYECLGCILKPQPGDYTYTTVVKFANRLQFKTCLQNVMKGADKSILELMQIRETFLQKPFHCKIDFGAPIWIDQAGFIQPPRYSQMTYHDYRHQLLSDSLVRVNDNVSSIVASFVLAPGRATAVGTRYDRNNKKGGQKNLRCFPTCRSGKHVTSGFCGTSIKAEIEMPRINTKGETENFSSDKTEDRIVTFCRFVVCAQGAHDVASSGPNISIGDELSRDEVLSLVRDRTKPQAPWIEGICESTTIDNEKVIATFEYNGDRMAWHYGWVAPRRQTSVTGGVQHALEVLYFRSERNNLRCIHILRSGGFSIHSSRRKVLDAEKECEIHPEKRRRMTSPDLTTSNEERSPLPKCHRTLSPLPVSPLPFSPDKETQEDGVMYNEWNECALLLKTPPGSPKCATPTSAPTYEPNWRNQLVVRK